MHTLKTWDVGFDAPIKGAFFGTLAVGRSVPEGAKNGRFCMDVLDRHDTKLVTPYQTHTSTCHFVDDMTNYDCEVMGEADALVTDRAGFAIGVVTADCVPVLFSGARGDGSILVGAAHAGARGALGGVLQNTVAMMRDRGAINIEASIGPCIQKQSYQVGLEFKQEFESLNPNTALFFSKDKTEDGKYLFDVSGYVKDILMAVSVPYVSIDVDTYTSPHCFSYRRATHRGEDVYGRLQLSAIMISA